mgnify:CR=1 FL=1
MSSFDFTPEQASEMFFSHLKWFKIIDRGFEETSISDWIPEYLPIEIKDSKQKLDYPNRKVSLSEAINHLKFGETVSWLIFGSYLRLDNHDDTLEHMQIKSGVDWLKIKVKPKIKVNRSNFKILFTLKKTESLLKAIKNDKFEFLPSFSGKSKRTY